jgi:hypothetical protein
MFQVEQLGAPYRALRVLKPLFFQETTKLGSSPLLQDLPRSVFLHHLYSRAPNELESPLQREKLTPKKYSLWLDFKEKSKFGKVSKLLWMIMLQRLVSKEIKDSALYILLFYNWTPRWLEIFQGLKDIDCQVSRKIG